MFMEKIKDLTTEPEFTKKIRSDLYRQADQGTLANHKLWDSLENDYLNAFEEDGNFINDINDAVAHAYWYYEFLTPAQHKAYPYIGGANE